MKKNGASPKVAGLLLLITCALLILSAISMILAVDVACCYAGKRLVQGKEEPTSLAIFCTVISWLVLIAALIVLCLWTQRHNAKWVSWLENLYREIDRCFGLLAARRKLCLSVIFFLPILARLALLPILPIPVPKVHDEFSYLLACDTFSSARLTNPEHRLAHFFETEHVLDHPTYMSKYPPAQGIVLAFGKVLFGRPWYGVLISFALMCTSIYWMAAGWLPQRWALFVGCLSLIQPGITSYWCNSYWGGCVSATGGALVLGSYPRLLHLPRIRDSLVCALGLVVLANSRPFEGLFLSLPIIAGLILGLYKRQKCSLKMAVTQMILPVLVITCLAAPAMMYYNFVITGSATRLPQAFYDQTHFPRLNWLGLPNNSALHHSNPQLDDFFCRRAFVEYTKLHSPGGWLSVITAGRLYVFWAFFLGSTLTPVLVALVWTLPDRRVRVLWICAGCLTAAVCIGVWWKVHYIAPFTAGLCVLIAQSIRHIYHVKISAAPLGKVLVRTMLTVAILSAFCDTFALAFYHVRFQEKLPRQALLDRLRAIPGQHLVIVHYGPDHDTHFEYVYNDADIDASRVIWARELGEHEDKQLLNYYKNRMVWILDADSKPAPRLMTLAESKSVKLSGSTNSPIQH